MCAQRKEMEKAQPEQAHHASKGQRKSEIQYRKLSLTAQDGDETL